MSEVSQAKRAARAQVRAVRRAYVDAGSPGRDQAAAAIAEAALAALGRLCAAPDSAPSRRPDNDPAALAAGRCSSLLVASYESLPTEPPTHELHERLWRLGHRVLVPVLLPDKDLDWREALAADRFGEPLGLEAVASADAVVVPALRIDRAGRRLGQGGGSYDRALARVGTGVPIIAVVDDDGLVDAVPHEGHDAPVHAVVRPSFGWQELTG